MTKSNQKILVVVPNVPKYDVASGDLRLYTMIKLLSQSYDVVVYDTEAWGKADDRYFSEMKRLGVQVYGRETLFKNLFKKYHFKAAILEFYHIAEYYLSRIRMLQDDCFIILDSVDVHFLREELKYSLTKDQQDLAKAQATKKKEMCVYGQSDCVLTVTKEDGEMIRKENPSITVEVIPNIHNTVTMDNTKRDKNSLLFVGSFSHEPNVDAMEYFCGSVMPLLAKELPAIKLKVVGANPPGSIKKYVGPNIEFLGFVPSMEPYLEECYISVAPLRFGAGMKGKIGEAMAHGVPVVTSEIGNQGLNLTHQENVMIAESPQQYVQCIEELVNNEELYSKISKNSIDFIDGNFSEQVVKRHICQIMDSVSNKKIKRFSWFRKLRFYNHYFLRKLKLTG